LTARYKWLDETDRSQVAFDMRPVSGISHCGPPAPGAANTSWYSRQLVKTCRSFKHIEPKVTVADWLTALLVVVMMLQHYTRVVPFPEGAPGHSADLACHADQLQSPRRMGLVDDISRNRRLSNGY